MKTIRKRTCSLILCLATVFTVLFVPVHQVYAKNDDLKTVTVAYFYDDDYFDGKYDVDSKSGYGYEYLQAIANYSGWKYKYVYGDYNSLLEQFMQGKIDLMPMISRDFKESMYYNILIDNAKNEESKRNIRNNKISVLYPNQPMNSEDYYLCFPVVNDENSDDYFSITSIYGETIAVPEAVADKAENWLKSVDISCEIQTYDTVASCINAFNKGEVKAIIGDNSAADEGMILYRKLGSIDYYLGVSSNNRSLLFEMNTALDNISASNEGLSYKLSNSYSGKSNVTTDLTAAEIDWVDKHPTIKIGTLDNDMPYSFYDSGSESVTGFVTYLIDEILDAEKVYDTEPEFVVYDSYNDMIQALNDGTIDAAFPVPSYLYKSEIDGYMCTNSVATANMAIVFDGEYTENTIATIAYPNSRMVDIFDTNIFPNSQLVELSSREDCLNAVVSGDVSSTILNEFNVNRYVRDGNKFNKLSYVTLIDKFELCIAVKRGNVALFTLLNRGVSLVNYDKLDKKLTSIIANEELNYNSGINRFLKKEYIIGVIISLTLIAIILVMASFVKKTQAASKKLKKANKEIKGIAEHQQQNFDVIGILARDYSSVYKVDIDTEEVEVYRLDDSIDSKYGDLFRQGSKFTEVFNQYVRDYVVEDDKPKMYDELSIQGIRKKTKQRNSYAVRYRKISNNNEPRYFEMRASVAETDISGKVLAVIVAFIDCNDEIIHEVKYMKSLEKALKSEAVITGLTGDFDWVAYVANAESAEVENVTHYRIGDLFKKKIPKWADESKLETLMDLIATTYVYEPDRKNFIKATRRNVIGKHLSKDSTYFVNFRIVVNDGDFEFYQLKFVADIADGKLFGFIIGFHSVDEEIRKEREQQVKLEQMVFDRTIQLEEKNNSLNRMNNDIIELMGNVVEGRDTESGEHVKRVKDFTNILATQVMMDLPEYGLTPEKVDLITSASALHDVGKITISDSILLKPGRLTDEEFAIMKTHTVNGCKILEKMPGDWNKDYLNVSMDICRYHHEKYDGKGYPDGLKGDSIPISAQIVAVADCYDALVSKRVYKDAFTCEQAFDMIFNGECGCFSPKLMQCFTKCKDSFATQAMISHNE